MRKPCTFKNILIITASVLLLGLASCKKNGSSTLAPKAPAAPAPVKIGLYAFGDSLIYKELQVNVSKVGTLTTSYGLVFDTGSGGMVLDAAGILPASMITSTGFNFTGDSTVVSGITITNQTDSIAYGGDKASTTRVYGNLAYAPVTIGDQNGSVVIKRLPFFLYYKGVDAKNKKLPAHYFDIMGVSPEYDLSFKNGVNISSPLSYYTPGTGLTSGFKLAAVPASNFMSVNGTYVSGALTVGLTASDLSASSGFTISQLKSYSGVGYLPYLSAKVTYGSKTISTITLFDTGTEPYSYIQDTDPKVTGISLLPVNTAVSITTASGFRYAYNTSATENLTYVEGQSEGGSFTIFGLEFFLKNEYLLDYTNHQLGLKND